jgi:signal transduction histidine kinase
MALLAALYIGIPVITIPIQLGLSYWVFRSHADVRGSRWFVASLLLGAAWMVAFVGMLLAGHSDLEWWLYVLAQKFLGASVAAWAIFAAKYARTDFHTHWVGQIGFGFIAASVAAPVFLRPVEQFFYRERTYRTDLVSYVDVDPGVGSVVVLLALFAVSGAALYSLTTALLSGSRSSRIQLLLLLLGSISVSVAFTVGATGLLPAEGLDYTAYGALPFSLCMTVALFRFRLFDLQPVARTAVVESLEDPIFVLDDRNCLVDVNAAGRALVDDPDGSVGEPLESAVPDLAAALRSIEADESAQLRMATDGRDRVYSVNVSRVSEEAPHPGWRSVVLRDVTALERSRWQLATQNERLDQVASTISHDLRNPINVAQGYGEMLEQLVDEDGLADADAADVQEYVDKIRHSHERMLEIIEDILTIAREGKSVEETEQLSLETVAREAWENVDTGEASLTVSTDESIQADRSKLLTVFENLVRNAVDHGPPDVTVEVLPTDDGFAVQDDGPGIGPEHREHVFEYGYSTATDSTGLGLSIVRTMAESHGWTVDLDPTYTDGARFVFRTVVSENAGTDDPGSPRPGRAAVDPSG